MIKQTVLSFFLVHTVLLLAAQNVGIGTVTPKAKLEVHNPVNSIVKISSANYNDTSRLILSNRDSTGAGTDFLISAIREQGVVISSSSDLSFNSNDSLLVLKTTGRLGLGVKNPAARLDVNGGARLAGFNTLELGGGIAGKETNAGKIGYGSFSGDALDIVGAGTSTTNRKIYLFAEGGTNVQGPLDISSNLLLSGNAGTAGQVLTSNGAAAPSWQSTSFTNTTRFAFKGQGGVISSAPFSYTTVYNTNPTDISIGTNAININRTGLYHLEGNIYADVEYFPSASYAPFFYVYFDVVGTSYHSQIMYDNMIRDNSVSSGQKYNLNRTYSIDIYITAGTSIKFSPVTYPDAGATISYMYVNDLRGYLISP